MCAFSAGWGIQSTVIRKGEKGTKKSVWKQEKNVGYISFL